MKRIVSWLSYILLGFLGISVIFVMVFTIAGLQAMYVVSESMEPEFYKGDLVLKSDLVNPGVGDIIAFEAEWLDGATVTHRVVGVSDNGFITKGDNNTDVDPITPNDKVVGVVVGKVPLLGWLLFPVVLYSMVAIVIVLMILEFVLEKRSRVDSKDSEIVKRLLKGY